MLIRAYIYTVSAYSFTLFCGSHFIVSALVIARVAYIRIRHRTVETSSDMTENTGLYAGKVVAISAFLASRKILTIDAVAENAFFAENSFQKIILSIVAVETGKIRASIRFHSFSSIVIAAVVAARIGVIA